ncbi:acyl-CoA thioesterase [Lentiprolixibacter aurantiacus]|uniref:Thioesterase family protein n=1 Tax=Lentiprolixibacter aurantiacus TaxID=2993939 RepID=A0AAE3MIK1_9FLAO|nr:thioesterase family protein [Lentiprolixibacter aurantiacus]MCX2718340.1 thioesterase family protein [Lentiprolixibacter aurantiacus]
MYFKEFEVRWNDLDANWHLANSSYMSFMSHTRMSFLEGLGFDHAALQEHQIGPVVFYEHMYYFREVLPGTAVRVSLEVMGLSEDGMYFEFHHNFYDHQGRHLAHCELIGGWISLKTRKLIPLEARFLSAWDKVEKPEGFRILTAADTRKYAKRPQDLA